LVRIHRSLKVTPATAVGVADRLWEISDIVKLIEWYSEERQKEGRKNSRKMIDQSYNPLGLVLGW
jgi:hypothetical protein